MDASSQQASSAAGAYAGAYTEKAVSVPELGKIKGAVERVAKARSDIECFLERFNGGGPVSAAGGADERTVGYRNDLASLFEQIERLEMTVSQLGNIG